MVRYHPESSAHEVETLDEKIIPGLEDMNDPNEFLPKKLYTFDKDEEFALVSDYYLNKPGGSKFLHDSIIFGKLIDKGTKISFLRRIDLGKVLGIRLEYLPCGFILDKNSQSKIFFFGVSSRDARDSTKLVSFCYDLRKGKLLHVSQKETNFGYCRFLQVCEDQKSLMMIDRTGGFISVEFLF